MSKIRKNILTIGGYDPCGGAGVLSDIKTFSCEEFDDGSRYLKDDYSIDCDSQNHKDYEIYAFVCILIYPIGVPLFFFVVLYKYRYAINPKLEDN